MTQNVQPQPNCKACHNPITRRPETALCRDCFAEMRRWTRAFASAAWREQDRARQLTPFRLFQLYITERLRSERLDLADWYFEPTPSLERREPTEDERQAAFWANTETTPVEVRYLRTHVHRNGCQRAGTCHVDPSNWQGPVLAATFHGVQIVKKLAPDAGAGEGTK